MYAKEGACVCKFAVEICGKLEYSSLGMRNLRDRSQSHEQRNFVLKVILVRRESSKHLRGSLRVTHVSHLLPSSLALDHVNHGRYVEFAHVVPCKVPVFRFVLVVVPRRMAKTESVATGVAQPNVVAGACSYEGRRDISVVHDPTICGVQDTVLH